MSRLIAALVCVAVASLALAASASAAVPKNCRLLPRADVGKPVGYPSGITTRGFTTANPSVTGAKGKVTLCDFTRSNVGTIASMSLARMADAAGAKREFSAIVKRERKSRMPTKKLRGAWDDAYWLGSDGITVLEGKHIFHLQYASGLPKFNSVTAAVLSRLAAKAVRKL